MKYKNKKTYLLSCLAALVISFAQVNLTMADDACDHACEGKTGVDLSTCVNTHPSCVSQRNINNKLNNTSSFSYTPMEKIPGFESAGGDFAAYILSIYRFGLWTVGIAALLMISVGGYMYITSAGNNTQVSKAKGVITDAIVGVLLALTSYLLLYTINPELVQIKTTSKTGTGGSGGTTNQADCERWCNDNKGDESTPEGKEYNANCLKGCAALPPSGPTAQTGLCKVENLQAAFGSHASKAACICNAESGGTEDKPSDRDICQPGGQAISWGLFQLNLSAHDVTADCACTKAGKTLSGKPCVPNASASSQYDGSHKNCTPQNNYNACKGAATNGPTNISYTAKKSKGGTDFGEWSTNSKCP